MAKTKTCTSYDEVETSIDTVSTFECIEYNGSTKVTKNNGNDTRKIQKVGDVKFIDSNDLPDIYSLAASESEWPSKYADVRDHCSNNQVFDNCEGNEEIKNSLTTISRCSGHRFKICSRNYIDSGKVAYPKSRKELIATFGYAYQSIFNRIADELAQRKQNKMYEDVGNNISEFDPASIQHSLVEANMIQNLNDLIVDMCRETVDPNDLDDVDVDFDKLIAPKDSINVIIDNTEKMMKDCICYSDCGEYSVCFCYSNCNHY